MGMAAFLVLQLLREAQPPCGGAHTSIATSDRKGRGLFAFAVPTFSTLDRAKGQELASE